MNVSVKKRTFGGSKMKHFREKTFVNVLIYDYIIIISIIISSSSIVVVAAAVVVVVVVVVVLN